VYYQDQLKDRPAQFASSSDSPLALVTTENTSKKTRLLVILSLALLLHSAFVATYHSLPESLFPSNAKERNERVCLLVGLGIID